MKKIATLSARRATGALALCASLSVGLLAGCRGSELNPETDLDLRYDAAMKIGSVGERDQVLASYAPAAADEGDRGNVEKALKAISVPALRNETAAECAVRLVKSGQRADANLIANSISDPGRRNDTFKRLAENDPGSGDPAGKGVRNYLGD